MTSLSPLPSLDTIRQIQARLRNRSVAFVLKNFFDSRVRRTKHFREWYKMPMNYARIMELPLTHHLLAASRSDRILDVSSPKLLALLYAEAGYRNVVAADLEEYFLGDFQAYIDNAKVAVATDVFDAAAHIPYADGHFDKIFSVSVLEHIPFDGDVKALREMLRVLNPTGAIVITLPAFKDYTEEWISSSPYWKSVQNDEGRTFFQRRYDQTTLLERVTAAGGVIKDLVLVGEQPVEAPRRGPDGRMLHNSYYIDRVFGARLLKRISRLTRLPLLDYFAESMVSKKCHYLTSDWQDPNIRQVALRIVKAPS